MLPGVIVPEAGLGDFKVGDHSTISIQENPFPFAVGYIETDSETIKENGLKGRGVKVRKEKHTDFFCFMSSYI